MRRRAFIAGVAGVALEAPTALHAQPSMPLIGFMSGRSPEDSAHLVAAFREGLSEAGFIEGQNVSIEFRWARGKYDLLPTLAADLVVRKVAVLMGVGGDPSARAAKTATSTIPIIFGMGGDPIAAGLVESFSRPGRNATGYTLWTNEMETKRLGLLRELAGAGLSTGILQNPSNVLAAGQLREIEAAARGFELPISIAKASNDSELQLAFSSLVREQVRALLVTADPYFDTRREQIVGFAAQNRLPTIYQFREFALVGGLISYGPSITDGYRQAGRYAGQILKGVKPADLPVLQPTKFELVINLTTAKALGLTIPPTLLARADEVIE
jgi:putative ABC transport system substrate-binding protein